MGYLQDAKKKVDSVTEAPIDRLNETTGMDWNPQKTLNEELDPTNPLGGVRGALNNAGGDISHAWKTSVNDPINKGINHVGGMLKDLWGKANEGYQTPGLPGMPGGVPQVGRPVGPGAGPAAPQQIAIRGGVGGATGSGVVPGTIAKPDASDPFRNNQIALMDQLSQQAQGKGPSLAAQQLKVGQEANLAATMAQLASARGGANPLLQRQTMQTSADIQAKTAQDAAMARLQEQLQAQGLLAQTTQAGRTGDIQVGQLGLDAQKVGLDAGRLDLDTQMGNAQVQQAHNDLVARYAAMGLDAEQANQRAAIDIADMQQRGILGLGALASQNQTAQNTLLGNGLSAAGGFFAAMSDARVKTDIKGGEKKLDSFLSALSASDYKYKNEKHGKGRFISPMAQDLEKTDIGKSMVVDTPEGKAVNYARAAGTILSAQAMLLKRVKDLEAKKGKR